MTLVINSAAAAYSTQVCSMESFPLLRQTTVRTKGHLATCSCAVHPPGGFSTMQYNTLEGKDIDFVEINISIFLTLLHPPLLNFAQNHYTPQHPKRNTWLHIPTWKVPRKRVKRKRVVSNSIPAPGSRMQPTPHLNHVPYTETVPYIWTRTNASDATTPGRKKKKEVYSNQTRPETVISLECMAQKHCQWNNWHHQQHLGGTLYTVDG